MSVVRGLPGFRWKGVPTLVYRPAGSGFKNIIRRVVLGEKEVDLPFQVRYFEMRRGGYSSLECHRHRHAVVVIRGRGKMFLKNRVHDLKPFDAVYIGKNVIHQFHQAGREPFGFLCMVAAKRDRPRLVTESKANRLRRGKGVRPYVRT
ncbi:cupin domain-containing protein [bacterium]|nr:cupin domain-containing protein [bacterium]